MRRRTLMALSCGWPLGLPAITTAQPQRMHRIAILSSAIEQRNLALVRNLESLGYEVGRNLSVDFRYADNRTDRLPEMARELVQPA